MSILKIVSAVKGARFISVRVRNDAEYSLALLTLAPMWPSWTPAANWGRADGQGE